MSTTDMRGPLPVARRARLLDALQRHQTVRISELTEILGVTAVTVRRDIAQLAQEGLVRPVHGGVTLARPSGIAADGADEIEASADPDRLGAGASATVASLRAKHTIGVLVPSLEYYWPDVVRGAEEAARGREVRLVLRGSSYETDDDRSQLSRLLDADAVDGLLFAPNLKAPDAGETLAWLAGSGVPIVLVERTATIAPHHEVVESVVTDHALGAALAVRHLAALGHRKVGLVTSLQSPTSPHVRRGWVEALSDLGASSDESVDIDMPPPQSPTCDEALEAVLDRCRQTGTTALLVHADAEAMALVQRMEDRGLAVPRDLSVVAYDDEVASLFSPSLSAVRPPRRSIGRAALELLTARLADPRRPSHRVVISPTLHVRESSGPPGSDWLGA